jgi:hypothetical protein
MNAETLTLPLDWDEWRTAWMDWRAAHPEVGRSRTRSPFQGKNFLADAVLGVYRVNGRTVEMSEVVFPNLSDRDDNGNLIRGDCRYIGLTFADGATDLARSFEDLERILGV